MAILSVERTSEALVIRLSLDSSADYIQNMLNYFTCVQAGSDSKVGRGQIDELAKEGKAGWWAENRGRFEGMEVFEDLPESGGMGS